MLFNVVYNKVMYLLFVQAKCVHCPWALQADIVAIITVFFLSLALFLSLLNCSAVPVMVSLSPLVPNNRLYKRSAHWVVGPVVPKSSDMAT